MTEIVLQANAVSRSFDVSRPWLQRMLAREPYEKGMIAWTLRAHAEVRQPDALFSDIPSLKPQPARSTYFRSISSSMIVRWSSAPLRVPSW